MRRLRERGFWEGAPGDSVHRPAFYIVHYDAGVSNPFVAEKIDLPEFTGRPEQAAFAPLTNMPCLEHYKLWRAGNRLSLKTSHRALEQWAPPTGHLAGVVTALLRNAGGMGEKALSVRPSTLALAA